MKKADTHITKDEKYNEHWDLLLSSIRIRVVINILLSLEFFTNSFGKEIVKILPT